MECEKCKGKGLVGNGDQPWLLQGHVITCPVCSGTGKQPEAVAPEAQTETAAPVETATEPKPRRGILSIFGLGKKE